MPAFNRPKVPVSATTLEGQYYTSDAVFARERAGIFARSWCCVTREEKLARPGDFIVVDIAEESLIVTRDRGGSVRAFFNVCRHRGTRICEATAGHFSASIQCPYHAWTYGLDGTLVAARNMQNVPGFSRADYPLREAAVATFDGFVFVNLDAHADPFAHAYAAVLERFARWDIAGLRTVREVRYDLACNWKLIFQNYSECYHCPLVHPQLDKLSPSDSGRNDLTEGPVLGGFSELRHAGSSLTTSGLTTRPPVGTVGGDDVNRVYYYTIFPTMLLSLHPDS